MEREKIEAEAEVYSDAATRLQAAERARGAKLRVRAAADARAEETTARDAAAARLQAAERGRTAKLEAEQRRRRAEQLGRGTARVAAKAEAAVARAEEARAAPTSRAEEPTSPARALLRESRASRASRTGGDTARTPSRKDRSPTAVEVSSGREARRRQRPEVTSGEASSVESLEGSDPRVATLRARDPPKAAPSTVASYLAQPAPTPQEKPRGATCDRHGLKDCFLCSLQGASLTSPLPVPRPGCAVHGVADCPVCGVRGGIALPAAATTMAAPASPEPCARHGLASCFLCSLRERGVGAAPVSVDRPPALALGGAASANRVVRGPSSYYAPLMSATTPAPTRAPARAPRSEPRPQPPRDPYIFPPSGNSPDASGTERPSPMRVRPAVAPKRFDDELDDDSDEPVVPRRRPEPRRNAGDRARKPRRAAGPYGSSSRLAPRRKTKAAPPVVPARVSRASGGAPRNSRTTGPPEPSDAMRAAKKALRGAPKPEFNM